MYSKRQICDLNYFLDVVEHKKFLLSILTTLRHQSQPSHFDWKHAAHCTTLYITAEFDEKSELHDPKINSIHAVSFLDSLAKTASVFVSTQKYVCALYKSECGQT